MFDANMRHLPKGYKFFAEMCGTRKDHPIRQLDLTSRLVLCEMLSEEHGNPTVRFFCGDVYVDISNNESGIGSWFVYSGNKDGSGFINDKSKAEAMRVLAASNR